MGRRLLFVFNPFAGKGLIKDRLLGIIDTFVKGGYEVTVYPTQASQDGCRKVKEVDGQYDLIVCSGGDGTLDEVVTGMMECEHDTPIGYIPAGSTNDFANSLGLSFNMLEAAQKIVEGTPFPCDVGRFNEDSFVYIAAFGLFTELSYQTSQGLKNVLGHLAYILGGIKSLVSIKSYKMTIEYDGVIIHDTFLYGMVTNSTSVGGFKYITPKDVLLDDGLFEVVLVKTPKSIIELQKIISGLLSESDESELIYSLKADNVKMTCDEPVEWTLDGEYGGNHTEIEIENKKRAVEIIVDKSRLTLASSKKFIESK